MSNDWIFFGTDEFAVKVLETLKASGLKLEPALVVTTPDKPRGRGLHMEAPPVKTWATNNSIPCLQPVKLSDPEFIKALEASSYPLHVVASYGKIIPKTVLDLPRHGTLNVHPSLLPQHRGPSPLEYTVLEGDAETGVTIMLMDEEVDHGAIVKQQKTELDLGQCYYEELRDSLAQLGGELLAAVMPAWTNGELKATPQDHAAATFTKKITKAEGELNLADDPIVNDRKIRALSSWPGTYFFIGGKRIKVTRAHLENSALVIDRVIPEGKREMSWADYKRNLPSV
jgi:methionyl-tRNA formyltransferase